MITLPGPKKSFLTHYTLKSGKYPLKKVCLTMCKRVFGAGDAASELLQWQESSETKRKANIFDICIRKVSKERRSYTPKLTHANRQARDHTSRNTLRTILGFSKSSY